MGNNFHHQSILQPEEFLSQLFAVESVIEVLIENRAEDEIILQHIK